MNRRDFLAAAGIQGLIIGRKGLRFPAQASVRGALGEKDAEAMSPNEDLMQEHALLERALLIYEETVRRLGNGTEADPGPISQTALIIRHFIEDYHEKLEEEHVFPRFEKAGRQTDLVAILRRQHEVGRGWTRDIVDLAAGPLPEKGDERKRLAGTIRSFIRMYRPHASREGSVLFPDFRRLLPAREFGELGALFEDREHELLGDEGFEGQVLLVAELEKRLGIDDLARYSNQGA